MTFHRLEVLPDVSAVHFAVNRFVERPNYCHAAPRRNLSAIARRLSNDALTAITRSQN